MQSYIIFFNKRIKVPQVSCLLNSRQTDERYELTTKLTFLITLFYIMMINNKFHNNVYASSFHAFVLKIQSDYLQMYVLFTTE